MPPNVPPRSRAFETPPPRAVARWRADNDSDVRRLAMLCEDAQANPLLGLPVVTKVVTTGNRAATQTKPTGNRAGSGPVSARFLVDAGSCRCCTLSGCQWQMARPPPLRCAMEPMPIKWIREAKPTTPRTMPQPAAVRSAQPHPANQADSHTSAGCASPERACAPVPNRDAPNRRRRSRAG